MLGEGVKYIHTDAHHTNPLCRVRPADLIKHEEVMDYDNEKYRDMLLEAEKQS